MEVPPGLNPILVLKIKHPSKRTTAGRQTVMDENQIKKGFDHIDSGLKGIGLHWVVCKMELKDDR